MQERAFFSICGTPRLRSSVYFESSISCFNGLFLVLGGAAGPGVQLTPLASHQPPLQCPSCTWQLWRFISYLLLGCSSFLSLQSFPLSVILSISFISSLSFLYSPPPSLSLLACMQVSAAALEIDPNFARGKSIQRPTN